MSKCCLTIVTSADGRESKVVREGEMLLADDRVEIRYKEESAEFCFSFENGTVSVDRRGDYSLRLRLKKGETLAGTLGIGDSVGEVFTKTTRLQYAINGNSVLFVLRYELLTQGGEPQKMKIRIFAKGV